MATSAIETQGLTKRYGSTLALDGLDLTVEPGEVYGFLGPNGAGKTTTIRLLLALHRPSVGRAALFGLDAWREAVAAHRRVAYVAGEPFLWPALTSAETFAYLARLHGSTDTAYRDALVQRFQLDTNKKVRALSKGNRQKVQLVAAFATRADLLILDEPTSGLDPLMEVAFRETVLEAKKREQTVFLSSHILSEVEAICDRVGILREGRLVDEGTLAQLRHLSAQTVDVVFAGTAPAIDGLAGVQVERTAPNALRFEVARAPNELLAALAQHDVVSLTSRAPSLEEIFLHHYDTATDLSAASAIARRTLAEARVRDLCFAGFFLLFAYANPVGYRHTYPTLKERIAFAASFGTNKAVELFYGAPRDLLTVGGFTAWRFGGFAAVLAGILGVLVAVRALRGEEDAGRQELVLASAVSRRTAFVSVVVAMAATCALMWLAIFVGLAAGGLPAGGSAYLALATVSPALVFAGVGALASQLASTRRLALELAMIVLAACFLLRVVADIAAGRGWLRWATPFGWTEELRAFADPHPVVLLLPALVTVALFVAAGAIALRRDVGTGILKRDDSAEPDLRLLSSPTGLAIRSNRGSLAAWVLAGGAFAAIIGLLSTSFTTANLSASLREQLHKLGGATITTPAGALGFYFLLFILAISLYGCAQVAAVRREEADQQLETLFALPVERRRWLANRVLLALGGAATIALAVSLLAWAGSASQHAQVSLLRLLEAGANCLPTAFFFLGLATLAFGLVPRATAGIAYGLVTLGFVWELFGSLFGAPRWLIDLTPFHHVGLVPGQPFRVAAAATLVAIAVVSSAAGVALFARRDLTAA